MPRLARLLFCLLLGALAAHAATWNVRDFGATGDGVTKDTAAFQKALDACAVQGGGEVLVPAGNYLIGSVQLGHDTTLRLAEGSVITGSPDLEDYPLLDIRWEGRLQPGHRALLHAAHSDYIAIVGPGRIVGNAATAASNRPPRGTLVIEFIDCHDVRWEGFTVEQPGNNWATHPTFCSKVVIKNLRITGQRDGIDVDSCRDVRIEDCVIETGDDCISLKSGRGLDGARLGRPTENVLITGCTLTCRRFACIGIGSETSAGVRDVAIEHSTLTAATHAVYIKSRVGRAGITEAITGSDLDIHGGGFLRLNLTSAGNTNTADDPVEGLAGYPAARHLSFSRIRLHDVASVVAATQTSPAMPVQGLSLVDISGTAKKGLALANVEQAVLRDIHLAGLTGPLLATENVTGEGFADAVDLPGRVTLWNGADLTGWKLVLKDPDADPATTWDAAGGLLRFHSPVTGYLRTEASYSNYRLHLEWRWPADAAPKSNSGVLVHLHGEDVVWPACIQVQQKIGSAGQLIGMLTDLPGRPVDKGQTRADRLAPVSEKPPGEWNACDIYAEKDTLEIYINGVRQNRVDNLPVRAGTIGLQLEGYPVEFRNLWLRPL
ncbi:MAG: hypothetical protein RIQ79_1865 [Verrucomicrobiota bacterium]